MVVHDIALNLLTPQINIYNIYNIYIYVTFFNISVRSGFMRSFLLILHFRFLSSIS